MSKFGDGMRKFGLSIVTVIKLSNEQIKSCQAIHIYTVNQFLALAAIAPEQLYNYLGMSSEKFNEIVENLKNKPISSP